MIATPVGFEPTRAKPNGLAGRRLNHSAKVSNAGGELVYNFSLILIRQKKRWRSYRDLNPDRWIQSPQ